MEHRHFAYTNEAYGISFSSTSNRSNEISSKAKCSSFKFVLKYRRKGEEAKASINAKKPQKRPKSQSRPFPHSSSEDDDVESMSFHDESDGSAIGLDEPDEQKLLVVFDSLLHAR
ncbi:hypothetical protein FQA39_LY15614 [Lamprigera yunnana]|nr:hypothetical protein FQA39_LY15614 [Lamprigera yunnana]